LKGSDPSAWIRAINPTVVYIGNNKNAMIIPISFASTYERANISGLVNSGATENFLDHHMV
jgi:hypothetical protein